MVRKVPGPKMNVPDKRKRTVITKIRYKARVFTQPTPSTNPNHTHPYSSHYLHPNASDKVHIKIYASDGI